MELKSALLVVLLAGCASFAPPRTTDPKLQPWQDFADAAAKAYGKWYAPRVEYALPHSPYEGARWSLGTIYVQAKFLDRDWMPLAFAHELGHYMLEHRGGGPQAEMEANAQAIEILVRVGKLDELLVLTAFYELFVGAYRARTPPAPGHASACEEIADLLRRYPKYQETTRTWECAR